MAKRGVKDTQSKPEKPPRRRAKGDAAAAAEPKERAEKFNYELAATALFEAFFSTDAAVAEKYEVAARTIQRWRERLGTDPALVAALDRKKKAFESEWVLQVPAGLVKILKAIEQIVEDMSKHPTYRGTPQALNASIEAGRGLADIYLSTKSILSEIESQAHFRGQHREEDTGKDSTTGAGAPADEGHDYTGDTYVES